MTKTIREIADELGVSKQAVQKRISREPLYTSIQPYIDIVDGTKYIQDDGIKLIKSAFNKNDVYTSSIDVHVDKSIDKNNSVHNDVYTTITITIDTLKEQLSVKDKQINDLNNRIAELVSQNAILADTIKTQSENIQAQQAITAGTIQMQLLQKENNENKEEHSNHWWSNLFRKDKSNE